MVKRNCRVIDICWHNTAQLRLHGRERSAREVDDEARKMAEDRSDADGGGDK